MVAVKNFKKKLSRILSNSYGKILTQSFLHSVCKDMGIKKLDECTENEQELVVMHLLDKTFSKLMKPEDLKKMKYIWFYKIFGQKKAMELVQKNEITLQPITFVYYVFGEKLGSRLIELGKTAFNKKDVERKNEFEQIKFVRKLIYSIFVDFSAEFKKDIDLRFLIFLKFGEDPEKTILELLSSSEKNKEISKMNILRTILSFYKQKAPDLLKDLSDHEIKDVMHRMGISKDEYSKWLFRIHNEIEKVMDTNFDGLMKGMNTPGDMKVAEIKRVLNAYVGAAEADEIITQTLKTLNIKDITLEDTNKKKLFIHMVMSNSIMNNFSNQKKVIIEDKLKFILF